MYDTKREEIKATILKRIEDSETFTMHDLLFDLGSGSFEIARNLLKVMYKRGYIDCNVIFGKSVWYKVKG